MKKAEVELMVANQAVRLAASCTARDRQARRNGGASFASMIQVTSTAGSL